MRIDWRAAATYSRERLSEDTSKVGIGLVVASLAKTLPPDVIGAYLSVVVFVLGLLLAAVPDKHLHKGKPREPNGTDR
ncbi:hypothetical protein [Azospirillum sp.]|uniref:hypothetical protein n=1 Tax=Azospirillum sp. TaxID=34012 RepID=UPI003D723E9A